MTKPGYIDVTDADLRLLVRTAYDLSSPQGLGFLHFKPEPLTDKEVDHIITRNISGWCVVSMDYVNGRACKFGVFKMDERLYIKDRWFDHTKEQLAELCRRCGVSEQNLAAVKEPS